MKNMLKALTKAENGIMFAAFAVMVASSFAQVVNRNFFRNFRLPGLMKRPRNSSH